MIINAEERITAKGDQMLVIGYEVMVLAKDKIEYPRRVSANYVANGKEMADIKFAQLMLALGMPDAEIGEDVEFVCEDLLMKKVVIRVKHEDSDFHGAKVASVVGVLPLEDAKKGGDTDVSKPASSTPPAQSTQHSADNPSADVPF